MEELEKTGKSSKQTNRKKGGVLLKKLPRDGEMKNVVVS